MFNTIPTEFVPTKNSTFTIAPLLSIASATRGISAWAGNLAALVGEVILTTMTRGGGSTVKKATALLVEPEELVMVTK